MKKVIISILIGLCCLAILFGGFVVYAMYRMKPVKQVIATDLLVSTEWSEILPKTPMQVNRRTQSVELNIDGYKHDLFEKGWQIKFPDGTIVKPEVKIFDEYGNVFDLHDAARVGNIVGFKPEYDSNRYTTFPKDRNYTKIRIRSDKPFKCSNITWTNMDLK